MLWSRKRRAAKSTPRASTPIREGWTSELYDRFREQHHSVDAVISEISFASTIAIHGERFSRGRRISHTSGHIRAVPEVATKINFVRYSAIGHEHEVASGCYFGRDDFNVRTRQLGVPYFNFIVYFEDDFLDDLERAHLSRLRGGDGILIRFMLYGRSLAHPSGINWQADYSNHRIEFPEVVLWTS